MAVSTTPTPTDQPQPDAPDESLGGLARAYFTRVRGGDVGHLPAILGLVALVVVFSILRPVTFTNSFNFANLINQSAGVMVIAMGLIFVLLLGEIDLSAGFTGGTAAAVMGIVMTRDGWPWFPSLVVCILTGAVIGTCIGLLVARLGIPSFVVTLAAFLGLQGVMLVLIGEGGTIAFRDPTILAIMNSNMPVWLGWTITIVGLALYAGLTLRQSTSRRAKGLQADPFMLWAFKTGALAVIAIAFTAYLSGERSRNPAVTSIRGIPIVVAVLLVLVLLLTFVLTRTAWGRHVYAVGGNAEAARRSGINVAGVKLSCFVICSSLAAVAGVLIASYTVGTNANHGDYFRADKAWWFIALLTIGYLGSRGLAKAGSSTRSKARDNRRR